MREEIKKSFRILIKNPYVMLIFILYFIVIANLMPVLYMQNNKSGFVLTGILFLLFTSAFFSGWFGVIKGIVSYRETGNIEEDFKNQCFALKGDFFSSVANYILPLTFYLILFVIYTWFILYFANFVMFKPDTITNALQGFKPEQMSLAAYYESLPPDVKGLLMKKSLFVDIGFISYFFFTLFSIPALFFQNTNNPLTGLFKGIAAIFKKPFLYIGVFVFILFFNVIISLLEMGSFPNQILMFISLVVRIYFTAFFIVLIFSIYEKNFTDNCNNGADSLGQDSPVN